VPHEVGATGVIHIVVKKVGGAHFDILERNEWSFRATGTMGTLHGDPSGNRCLGPSTWGASARVRVITPEKF